MMEAVMEHAYEYLVVGAGMAGDAAAHGIREVDASGPIGMIGAEDHPPYDRPPLSKALWKGEPAEKIWRSPADPEPVLHRGRRAIALDAAAHLVTDDHGDTYRYGKLLLATGGEPRRLYFDGDRVVHYRTWDDYQRVRALAAPGTRFGVVGGGFIGSEMASSLASNGCKVTLLFPDAGIGARVYPPALGAFLGRYFAGKGVAIRAGVRVEGGSAGDAGVEVVLDSGERLAFDALVAGLGVVPEVALAKAGGLEVDNGVLVDAQLHASAEGVYAAGDIAAWPDPALGVRRRVEHEDNALSMGRQAGRNMAGAGEPYTHLPMFYSDLFDLGYEAVGELDARLETFEDWVEPFREGVVYYLRDGRVRGVLLWNTWGQVDAARALIGEAGPHDRATLKGRLGRRA
jgi:NADPH-dependent 2,4-dienoyl-CoA reductase/sulfur reductase-like enzyme